MWDGAEVMLKFGITFAWYWLLIRRNMYMLR